MFNGFIQFGVLGGRESQKGVLRATQDENTVMIKKDDNDAARKIANFVEAKIFEKNTNIGVPSISIADEIKKFKELLDLGVLTQEEFDKKKTELLNT